MTNNQVKAGLIALWLIAAGCLGFAYFQWQANVMTSTITFMAPSPPPSMPYGYR